MTKLPPGYRFIPTNEQLIVYYLRNKVKNLPLPSNLVVERDLYGTLPPWDLFMDETDPWQTTPVKNAQGLHTGILDRTIYVLTKLKKASRNRISRTAGCGVWHGDGVNRPILDDHGTLIGTSRSFFFKVTEKVQVEEDRMGHWIMHEVTLPKEQEAFEQQHVICKITRDDSKPVKICPKRPRPSSSGEEEDKNTRKIQKQHDNNNTYKHHLSAAAQVVPENNMPSDQDLFNGLHEMMNLPQKIADGWMFSIRDENVSSVQPESLLVTSDDQIGNGYSTVNALDYILPTETSRNITRSGCFALNDIFENTSGLSCTDYDPTLQDASSNYNVHESTCNIEDFLTSENNAPFEQQQQCLNIAENQPSGLNCMEYNPTLQVTSSNYNLHEGTCNTEDFYTSGNNAAFEQQQQWLNIAEDQPSCLSFTEYNPTLQGDFSNYNVHESTCNIEDLCSSGNNASSEQQQQRQCLNITENQPMEAAASDFHVPNLVITQPLEGSEIMEMPPATVEDEASQRGTAVESQSLEFDFDVATFIQEPWNADEEDPWGDNPFIIYSPTEWENDFWIG